MNRAKPGKELEHAASPRPGGDVCCDRCGGRMSYEWFSNRNEEGGYWHFQGWRCLYCGEVIDRLIVSNRGDIGDHRRN
ncbi:MAG: hypothetical protein ACE5FZ_03340 [Nitrospiria bacterium]